MPKDFQETRKGSPIMKEKQPQQHVDLKVGHLIYIRYRDHVLYHRTQPEILGPQTRECVGWLIYDCTDYIILRGIGMVVRQPLRVQIQRHLGLFCCAATSWS
jgi:hypothetical protein